MTAQKLTRVQPLLDHVRKISKELFQPFQDISADERMLPSKHKLSGIRQFCKNKPIRFGFKLFVLACTKTGYTYDFLVYLGKKGTVIANKTKGLAYNIVMQLCKSFYFQGYHLFVDRFYTSLHLAQDIFEKGINFVGTVNYCSTAMPKCFKDVHEWEKVASRGDLRWIRTGDFVVVQWLDSNTVTLISSMHKGSDITQCDRMRKDRTGYKRKKTVQPLVVHDYNTGMGGVDKSDQFLHKYPCYIRSRYHWWKVLFFHCIDMMIVNSFIIFSEYCKVFPNDISLPATYGQLEFRESLVMSLLEDDIVDSNIFCNENCMPEFSDSRLQCVYCTFVHHNDQTYSKHKTSVTCTKCKVALCLSKERNCFVDWHSPSGAEARKWIYENYRFVKC